MSLFFVSTTAQSYAPVDRNDLGMSKDPSQAETPTFEIVPADGGPIITAAKQEKIDALVGKIRPVHDRILGRVQNMQGAVLEQANDMRAAGEWLAELKAECGHKGWQGVFATAKGKEQITPVLPFDYMTGQRYMRFAKAFPEPLKLTDVAGKRNATEIMVSCGAIQKKKKDGEKIHEVPTLTEMFINFHMEWNEFLHGVQKLYPQADWNEDDTAKIKRQLKPIVDFFHSI